MSSDELKKRVREILGELSGTILQDNPNYVMPTEEFLKAEQAIYGLMLELIKDLPNPGYVKSDGLRHEPVDDLRQLIKGAKE